MAWRRAPGLRRGLAALVAATIVGAPALAATARAAADDIANAQAEAATLARRIDDQGRQEEILAEQYDGARVHADEVDSKVADATQQLGTLAAGYEATHRTLVQEAVSAYVHGGYGSDPAGTSLSASTDLGVERDYFALATGAQSQTLDRLHQAQAALRAEQAVLLTDQQNAAAAVAALDARRHAVEQADAASKATLAQVQGQLVQLVAQQQAALDAQRQAEERALLASSPTTGATPSTTAPAGPTTTAAHPPTSGASTAPSNTAASTTRAPARPATTGAPLLVTAPPASSRTTTPTTSPAAPPAPDAPVSRRVAQALAFAVAQLGKQYEWGAAGPDTFDCSGLTMRAWGAAGVSLPHYAAAQYAEIAHVPIADLKPGDLVFFGTDLHHVGIYVGGGQMIDAPHTGAVVQYDSIYWPDLQPFGGRPD